MRDFASDNPSNLFDRIQVGGIRRKIDKDNLDMIDSECLVVVMPILMTHYVMLQ